MDSIDRFVTPVPTAKRAAYLDPARQAAVLFKEFGALRVVECWGDDVPDGRLPSFPIAVKREAEQTAVFSWFSQPSRVARDASRAKLMADVRMQPGAMSMPFEDKRIVYSGFETLFDT